MIICVQRRQTIAIRSLFFINSFSTLNWIPVDVDIALFVCPSVTIASHLFNWGVLSFPLDAFDFLHWMSDLFALRYDCLFKRHWIRVWGLPLNLWLQRIFQAIVDICGGLWMVDYPTLACEELRWARLEVDRGDLRSMPRFLSVVLHGRFSSIAITIKNELY